MTDQTEHPDQSQPHQPQPTAPTPDRTVGSDAPDAPHSPHRTVDSDTPDASDTADAPHTEPARENEVTPLTPPDPQHEHPDPDPFADGPPPLPQQMLVLDGELPEQEEPQQAEPVDHGTCAECGGAYDEDGWCTQCGQRRPNPRDHFTDRPADHVAGACDRGRRHAQNQDAMALLADPGAGRTVLVVCDGVSSAERSAEASQAAAGAAVEVLERDGAPATTRLVQAADAAIEAIEQVAQTFPGTAPSCTMVAGVIEDGTLTVGSVGDSRAYWLPDAGDPVRLTSDDSMAEEQVRAGMQRAEAEAGPMAHTITRWLGPDAPDHTPRITTQAVDAPGWALLCTDGLWNYASEPRDLAAVVRAGMERVGSDPLDLALALVEWANEQGGADNITVALARTGGTGQDGTHG